MSIKIMSENEDKARRIMRGFCDLMASGCGSNWHLAHPAQIKLVGWHNGKAAVSIGPRSVKDINPATVDRFTKTGVYASSDTLYRAYLKRSALLHQVRDWLLVVNLYRRSGIPEIGELGKLMKEDFGTVPALLLRTDDMDAPSITRTRYAMACAMRLFHEGKATCPHCGGHAWTENLMGIECDGCGQTWSDTPDHEGWTDWRSTSV